MNMHKPPTRFKVGNTEFDLSQSIHVDKQEWRKHLVLVSALPERMIGLVENPNQEEFVPGRSFKLGATLIYIAELSFAPVVEIDEKTREPIMEGGQPKVLGVRGSTKLHALIPYDFIGTPTVDVGNWQYMIRIADQEEGMRNWLYHEYQGFFDRPKILDPRLVR